MSFASQNTKASHSSDECHVCVIIFSINRHYLLQHALSRIWFLHCLSCSLRALLLNIHPYAYMWPNGGVFCSLGSTSSVYDNQGPHKGHHESTTSPGETATTKIDSQPRSARVPGGFLKSNVLKIQWQNCLHMNWSKRWKWRSNALFRLCCATDCIQHFTSSLKDGAYCNSCRFSAILRWEKPWIWGVGLIFN